MHRSISKCTANAHSCSLLAERLDANGDGELAVEEFAQNPRAVDKQEDVQQAVAEGEYPGDWSETRAREFRTEVDINGDGRASLQELNVRCASPTSGPHHSPLTTSPFRTTHSALGTRHSALGTRHCVRALGSGSPLG